MIALPTYIDAPPTIGRRFVVDTPARNEAKLLPGLAHSLMEQSIRPALWVIVDDGSIDGTSEIADDLARAHPWIRVVRRNDRGRRVLGGGVVAAFDDGLAAVDTPYDFVGKVDADLTFGPRYIERLCERFESDSSLGSASGKVFRNDRGRRVEEFMIDDMVAGQWKTWRAECYREIGGLVRAVMWDGIDFHRARMCGWKTRSIDDPRLSIHHHRLMGSSDRSVLRGRLRWGAGQWFLGSHPAYLLASAVLRMSEKPRLIGGALIAAGYFRAALTRKPRYGEPQFRSSLRAWQLKRLRRLVLNGEVR